jgi:hypothetical protein
MKRASREVGVATEHTGRAVEIAAVKTGREVKWGARKIIHKSARATEKGAAAVKNKTRL